MTRAEGAPSVAAPVPAGWSDADDVQRLPIGDHRRMADRGALQTELAVDRTLLAVERTYDAWIRTGLAALASGIGARALLGGIVPPWLAKSTSAMLALFAAFCFLVGAWREISTDARLPGQHIRQLPPALLIVVNGFLVVVALAAFAGLVAAP